MKILGVLGSPRIKGNSDILLDEALRGAKDCGAKTEKVVLVRKRIAGCLDCRKCNKTGVCAIQDDMQGILGKIVAADAILHSCPVYFWAMTAQMKAYLDRWCALFDEAWQWQEAFAPRMKGKRIGLITVCGDKNVATGDPIVHSFRTLAAFSGLNLLPPVQCSAMAKGDIRQDEKSLRRAYALGRVAAT